MADVFLDVHGNGYANCDAVPPLVEGEQFTITLYPDPGEEILQVKAFDSHDYSVALAPIVDNKIIMNFRSNWGNLYVEIYFSGGPEPPSPGTFEPWLLAIIKKRRRGKCKH